MMNNPINRVLSQIKEGMDVYTRDGKKVGSVDFVHFGEENPARPGPETVTGSAQPPVSPMVQILDDVFDPDPDMPDTVRARLLREGFIRVDAGLLRRDRFFTSEQIAGVTSDRVSLSVARDDLS